MTTLQTTADRLASAPAAPFVASWLARAWTTVTCWVERSRSRSELAAMDERMLRDIGLTRADVIMEDRKHFWER
jgi:uncharacterized protein YjiS (DUF1127 family)